MKLVSDTITDLYSKITVTLTAGMDSVVTPYYLINKDGTWYICSALPAYTQEWFSVKTEYAEVYFSDSIRVNDYALEELDRAIIELAGRLGIRPERMEALRESKIRYYLCNEDQMELITGYRARGMTNFQVDAIVTCHLPHTHELTHLMVNYCFEKLPLYTLPLVQEGIACVLGGRWGKSPSVIYYWGNVSLGFGLVDLDSILTYNGFFSGTGNLDASYSVSSLLVKSLIDNHGIDKFKALYLELSGGSQIVRSFADKNIITTFEKTYGTRWDSLKSEFADVVNDHKYSGIIPCRMLADSGSLELSSEDIHVKIRDNDSLYIFQITYNSQPDAGMILFSDNGLITYTKYKSGTFSEHLPEAAYNNEIYGIRFSPEEVGFYNYFTDVLLAKYVAGFTPDDRYWDTASKIIGFSLNKTLLEKNILKYDLHLDE
jgi:hypothetical protein